MARPLARRDNVCIVQPALGAISETFLRAQAERLPAEVTVVHGWIPQIGLKEVHSRAWTRRQGRKLRRLLAGQPREWEITLAFIKAFRLSRADVVLAQYGPTGVRVIDACRAAHLPLVVHFHGHDASRTDIITENAKGYRAVFEYASAIISVSHMMTDSLVALGAPREKVHWSPCGVDLTTFHGSDPSAVPPVFLTVGRFTEKKAPQLTLLAFAKVARTCANARLRMIGDGPLLPSCRDLARALRIEEDVVFLRSQPPEVVRREMREARCFVQHSVKALETGDCEGTPVGIVEAAASGLPVVSTRHAGIPDVVLHGQTGFLVDEHDVDAMAEKMIELAMSPRLAATLGNAARRHIQNQFSMEVHIARLWQIIKSCIVNWPR